MGAPTCAGRWPHRTEARLAESYEQAPDTELVTLARQGDEAAFAEIVRRHSPRVFHTVSRFFRQHSQVEDAAQEVFLRLYTRLADYEARGSFAGWVTRIATTTCLNLLRNSQRRPEAATADLSQEQDEWLEQRRSGSSWAARCAAAGAGRAHRAETAHHVRAHSLPAFNSPARCSMARAVIAIIVNVGF